MLSLFSQILFNKKMKMSKNSLRGLVASVYWNSWARPWQAQKGEEEGREKRPLSPIPLPFSLLPYSHILFPFWCLLCRLVIDCCCYCFFSFLFSFLKLSYSSAASLSYSTLLSGAVIGSWFLLVLLKGNDIDCVACLPRAPFSLFAPIC